MLPRVEVWSQINSLPRCLSEITVEVFHANGSFPFYMKFEKIQNRQKYHHSLKEHPMFSKIAKFGCEML